MDHGGHIVFLPTWRTEGTIFYCFSEESSSVESGMYPPLDAFVSVLQNFLSHVVLALFLEAVAVRLHYLRFHCNLCQTSCTAFFKYSFNFRFKR